MDIRIPDQAAALLLALTMGLGLGVLYDLLRPLRHRLGRLSGTLLDGVFCLAAGSGIFSFAMLSGGRLGTWELVAVLLGFLAYIHILSRYFLPIAEGLFLTFENGIRLSKKILEKFLISAKRVFQNVRE